MNAPAGLTGAGLLFWGLQCGLLPAAVPLALLVEAGPYSPRRLDLSRQQFHRASDLCTLLFVAAAALLYTAREASDALRLSVIALPLMLLPLMLAQAYSVQGAVDTSVFFWSWRRRQSESGPRRALDARWLYLACCVFAASAANRRDGDFYAGLLALAAWALWSVRRPGVPVLLWAALFASGAAAGRSGYGVLARSQVSAEEFGALLAYRLARSGKSPFSVRTAIGSIGTVKGSGLILMRVEPLDGGPVPPLLRNAAYNEYEGGEWSARGAALQDAPAAGPGRWTLAPGTPGRRLRLWTRLAGGAGLLALPEGTMELSGLEAQLRANRLGAARVDDGPSLAQVEVGFRAGAVRESPPDPADLDVPAALRGTLGRIASGLGLSGRRAAESVAAVRRHFDAGLAYSVYQGRGPEGDPVEHFLLRSRSGHCEYFATATALLLRAGGVPARYATGFAVSEYSRLEGAYVVRGRHAHAWAQAFVDGRWTDVDTTPPTWSDVEDSRAPSWQPLRDIVSLLEDRVRRELRDGVGGLLRRRGAWLLIPLAGFLAVRIAADLRRARARRVAGACGPARRGLDSEFFEVERKLSQEGLGRRTEESVSAWLARLRETPGGAALAGRLEPVAALHERYRFDPRGLSPEDRRRLRDGAAALAAQPPVTTP